MHIESALATGRDNVRNEQIYWRNKAESFHRTAGKDDQFLPYLVYPSETPERPPGTVLTGFIDDVDSVVGK
jgi:hypothetical protein